MSRTIRKVQNFFVTGLRRSKDAFVMEATKNNDGMITIVTKPEITFNHIFDK